MGALLLSAKKGTGDPARSQAARAAASTCQLALGPRPAQAGTTDAPGGPRGPARPADSRTADRPTCAAALRSTAAHAGPDADS